MEDIDAKLAALLDKTRAEAAETKESDDAEKRRRNNAERARRQAQAAERERLINDVESGEGNERLDGILGRVTRLGKHANIGSRVMQFLTDEGAFLDTVRAISATAADTLDIEDEMITERAQENRKEVPPEEKARLSYIETLDVKSRGTFINFDQDTVRCFIATVYERRTADYSDWATYQEFAAASRNITSPDDSVIEIAKVAAFTLMRDEGTHRRDSYFPF